MLTLKDKDMSMYHLALCKLRRCGMDWIDKLMKNIVKSQKCL